MYKRFDEMVKALAKKGDDIVIEMTPKQADLLHMAVGVNGEAGELLDAVKKHVIYQKALDVDNVVEELGDLEFYMQGLRDNLGISREEVIQHNVDKLSVRYGKGTYSNVQAIKREDKNEAKDR